MNRMTVSEGTTVGGGSSSTGEPLAVPPVEPGTESPFPATSRPTGRRAVGRSLDGETTADLLLRMQDIADPGESLRLVTVHPDRHAGGGADGRPGAGDADAVMSRRDRRRASHGGTGRGGNGGVDGVYGNAHDGGRGHRQGLLWSIMGILAELLLTMAAVCGLYVAWQMWWTGVQSEHAQVEMRQSANWTSPGSGSADAVAPAQEGDPPVQPESAAEGDLIATVYIPRFGDQWERNLVQGTSLTQLNKHGLGHYTESQWPGQVGNFALAGHRNGYGQPLGDVDKLQPGDAIVVRTQDYWYVYEYTSSEIVLPDEVRVIGENPLDPGVAPTARMITMTTCEPKYSTPTHRWISYGTLKYWAKVADGWPQELATSDVSGGVTFTNNMDTTVSPVARLDSLAPVVAFALVAYAIVFVAALVAWRFPLLRAIRAGERRRPDVSLYGWLMRHQPGVLPIRVLLMALLLFAAAAALFEWGFPWAASTIPYLQQMSNFTAV